MKKFGIIGTHSSGKTTTAHYAVSWLKEHNINAVEMLPEIARECPSPINEKADFKSFFWILTRQIQEEVEMESRCEVLITDRTVLDEIAYANWFLKDHNIEADDSASFKFICRTAWNWVFLKPYDFIFFFHPLTLVPDGVRSTSLIYQLKIHNEFLDVMAAYPKPYIELDAKMDKSKRNEFVAKRIFEMCKT